MSTRTVLLGLLQKEALHGYELKQIIEQHMGDWTSIAFGSIYFALNKLEEEGFIEKVSEEQVGKRPSRSTFKITEKGETEFLRLLRENWQSYERAYYPLDIALAFSSALPKKEIIGYITRRIEIIENIISHLKQHKAEQLQIKNIPKIAKNIFSHTEHHIKAELKWLNELLHDIKNGSVL